MADIARISDPMSPADQNRFVRAHASLYKKSGDRTRMAAVTRNLRAYARDILPGLMISRRDPVVLATQEENPN